MARESQSYFSAANKIIKKDKVLSPTQAYYPYCSKYEKRFARMLTNFGIEFKYEPEFFRVEINEEVRHYVPDFYLPEYDQYVELTTSPCTELKNLKIDNFLRANPDISFIEIDMRDIEELEKKWERKKLGENIQFNHWTDLL